MTSTVNGTEAEDAIPGALAAGLLGIDASRRVGWAKAFDRARHIEDLEEQVSVLRSELKQLRLCYIRLVGFTTYLPISMASGEHHHRGIFDAEIGLHRDAVRPYFNRKAFNSGRDEAVKHRAAVHDWTEARLKAQMQKHEQHTAREREDTFELIDAARRAGHDARFDIQPPDNRFFCSCTCGEHESFDTQKEALIWQITHRVAAVHGTDIKGYRKLRKAKRRGPRCICDCGNVHPLKQDDEDMETDDGWLDREAQRLASDEGEVTPWPAS